MTFSNLNCSNSCSAHSVPRVIDSLPHNSLGPGLFHKMLINVSDNFLSTILRQKRSLFLQIVISLFRLFDCVDYKYNIFLDATKLKIPNSPICKFMRSATTRSFLRKRSSTFHPNIRAALTL